MSYIAPCRKPAAVNLDDDDELEDSKDDGKMDMSKSRQSCHRHKSITPDRKAGYGDLETNSSRSEEESDGNASGNDLAGLHVSSVKEKFSSEVSYLSQVHT